MKVYLSNIFLFVVAASLVACGGDSGSNSGGDGGNNAANKPQPKNRVDWSTVPSEFNPFVEEIEFRTDGFEKINVDVYGFNDDVEVVYTNEVPPGYGYIKFYKVWKDQVRWGEFKSRPNGTTLDLRSYGSYQCSIRVANRQITDLKGGCLVRLQVFMAPGSEIEVYNIGQLLTKRFIPIKTEVFLELLLEANWTDDKFAVIENYLASYNGTKKKPMLTAAQLGVVVGEFSRREEKYQALAKLHSIVIDRENLVQMIEDKFSYFEREEARRIVGL